MMILYKLYHLKTYFYICTLGNSVYWEICHSNLHHHNYKVRCYWCRHKIHHWSNAIFLHLNLKVIKVSSCELILRLHLATLHQLSYSERMHKLDQRLISLDIIQLCMGYGNSGYEVLRLRTQNKIDLKVLMREIQAIF